MKMSRNRVKGDVSLGVLPMRVLESTIPTIKRVKRITRKRRIQESLDLIRREAFEGGGGGFFEASSIVGLGREGLKGVSISC